MKAQEHKELKQCGKQLGRETLACRVIELCKEVVHENNYKEAIRIAGKIHAIAIACGYDEYWSEKRDNGYYNEIHDLKMMCQLIKRLA